MLICNLKLIFVSKSVMNMHFFFQLGIDSFAFFSSVIANILMLLANF